MNRREKPLKQSKLPERKRTPSFSSALLDDIYRSLDEPTKNSQETSSVAEKHSISRLNLRQAVMIEKFMEKQSIQSSVFYNYSSSSSESNSSAPFSSSETDSTQKRDPKTNPFGENGRFSKTKLRAMKIYGELKKVKQPISPGGKISNFLNSIFNSRSVKKEKKSKSECSSGSAFHRPCLSKPNSSREKLNSGNKRSVKFCPVSVIFDEDCNPCGQKSIYKEDPVLMQKPTSFKYLKHSSPFKNGVMERERDFLRGVFGNEENDEDEDDDAESYASSDLFEIDHLVGIGRYCEELPVYETTSLRTNQAIANGFIL